VNARKQLAKKARVADAALAELPALALDEVMTTVFRLDGTISAQNTAARLGFAAPESQDVASPFLRHFVSARQGAMLLDRVSRGETVRAELPVYTAAGIRRLRFVAAPLDPAANAERLFLLVETATPGIPRDDETHLRDYAEAAADWFWEMDAGLRFSYMSESTQLPASGAARAFIGKRLIDIAAEDGDGKRRQSLTDLLEARLPFRDIRLRCREGNGLTRHLSFSGLPIFDSRGEFSGYRGIGRDLTLLVRAETHAAVAQDRLLEAIESIAECFMLLDAEDRLVLCNSRYREVNGAVAQWLVPGTPLKDIYRASLERGTVRPASGTLEGRFAPSTSGVGEGRLGDRWFQISERRTRDGGSVVVQTEITALKRREQELAEKTAHLHQAKEEAELASRTKTEFLANISHELRTPLNAIIGFAEILNGQIFGPLGDKRYINYAADIRDSGQHLLTLINDVLDVSKIEFGKLELNEEPVDVAAVVDSSIRLMRDRAEHAGLEIRATLPPGPVLVQADERRLKQILLNLLSNAVKFTPAAGQVTIGVAAGPDGLRITIADTGIGIAPEDLEKALRPFGQIDSSMARKYQGTGLGLPLTKSMIELHGGRLTLASESGRGTTATIWLPPERLIALAAAELGASAIADSRGN